MNVYLNEYIHPDAVRKLEESATIVRTFDAIDELDAIILRNTTVTGEMMERAKRLKVIGKHGVGCNTIDLVAAKELGIPVLYTPLANVNSVAEMIVGLILNAYRGITIANKGCHEDVYESIAPQALIGKEVRGKTLGLIGLGNISLKVAEILKRGFDVEVYGYDPFVTVEKALELGIKKFSTVKEIVRVSDIVNISVPLTKDTENIISGEVFDCFKEDAILINASRGGTVNEEDLYHALRTKKLKAAACDVFLNEPPSSSNQLLELDNFCATPHIGGNTEESLYRAGMEVVTEVLNVLNGKKAKFSAYS